jgi:hypothetical protein
VESWRAVWRKGIAPQLSREGLASLRDALRRDDARLLQGATTSPPPLMCVQDWPLDGCDAVAWCYWRGGDGLATVGAVEEAFARACFECDQKLGEPAACRWFRNWYDEAPRDEVRRELLAEVELALAGAGAAA